MKNLSAILIFMALVGCYKEDKYEITNYKVDEVILEIETTPDTLMADGSSICTLRVFLPNDAEESLSTVKIDLSIGTFTSNKKSEISSNSQIRTYEKNGNSTIRNFVEHEIQSPISSGAMIIEVEVQSLVKTHRITLLNNPINELDITPSALQINPYGPEEINILCQAGSEDGTPSKNQLVDLVALDSLFNPIGSFRTYDNTTDGEGKTSYNFSLLPDSTYTGRIYFIANETTNSAKDTSIIYSIN